MKLSLVQVQRDRLYYRAKTDTGLINDPAFSRALAFFDSRSIEECCQD